MLSSQKINLAKVAAKAFASPLSVRTFASSAAVARNFNIELHKDSFESYKCEVPSLEVSVSKDDLLHMYKSMVVMRRMEMASDGLYKAKLIRGFCHLCTGQEAVAVGMETALTAQDNIITAYRCHGFTYMRGGSITSILAELLGRRAGISGGNGIVGAQVPLGAGIAFAQKYLGQKAATFSLYGDGASNQGQVFEAYNMAKLWDLPAVFVCENNRYGMGTAANRSSANTSYFKRGDYIPGLKVNGMDVVAVRQAVAYAKEWAVSGKGPLLLEMETYRYGGHSMSDPGTTYRTREEIQHMRSNNDPITGLKQRIFELDAATEDELKAIDKAARAEVDQATEEAKASPEPDVSQLFTQIYQKSAGVPFLRGREPEETHYY
ncbi:alpha subunit of pyruvate dehydrogenase [Lunasporangiospora selenospora]|uniref:Pyruvate dehydrogenase E1 component subunit alpha, mitochondrial n=1 Tax=Lunasporangiospora selenospora TaxID=979761 RepID=A0A9P6FT72_9FUNG|nr:alpha subunit of pyruvate dehydrogenase [Lunasporangiospora selenospora]